jgi:hypothetical protein
LLWHRVELVCRLKRVLLAAGEANWLLITDRWDFRWHWSYWHGVHRRDVLEQLGNVVRHLLGCLDLRRLFLLDDDFHLSRLVMRFQVSGERGALVEFRVATLLGA